MQLLCGRKLQACVCFVLSISALLLDTGSALAARLTHGPVVGAVTATTANAWVRTDSAAEVRLKYSLSPDLSDAVETEPFLSDVNQDFAHTFTLPALLPSTTYYVDVIVDELPQFAVPYQRFKTFAVAGAATPFKFVVLTDFSVASSPGALYSAFAAAAAENPDFVLISGDFDHRDPLTIDSKRQMFKDIYTPAHGLKDFVNLILRQFPIAHHWDDHDYGVNNGDKNYVDKALSRQILQEYFPVYELPALGDYQKFSYGNADFFLLDSRSQRDPHTEADGPLKSMLDGDNFGVDGQLYWLLDSLTTSEATWKFIVTPVTFNPTVPKQDSWFGFLYERQVIIDYITNNNIAGVILISGDLHAGGIDDGTNSAFPEMLVPAANLLTPYCLSATSSGSWSEGFYANFYGPYRIACNGYGVVTVGTEPDSVKLQVKGPLGGVKLNYDLVP